MSQRQAQALWVLIFMTAAALCVYFGTQSGWLGWAAFFFAWFIYQTVHTVRLK